MFDWLSSILANLAYDAAIKSVDVASHNGMHQMEEPETVKTAAARN